MRKQETSTLSGETTSTPPGRSRRALWIVIALFALVALGGLGLVAYLNIPISSQPLAVSRITTARGLDQNQVLGEGRLFDVGEQVFLVFNLENGKAGHNVSVQMASEGKPLEIEGLAYAVQNEDSGARAVMFKPEAVGIYTATLHLDQQPVANEQVTFRVVVGGPKLQEVQTAAVVDETFRPTAPTASFTPQSTIYIVYRAVGAAAGDTLQVKYYINGEPQPPDPKDQDSFSESGNFRGYFSVQGQPANGLRTGNYRAELYYNQDLVSVVNFTVQ